MTIEIGTRVKALRNKMGIEPDTIGTVSPMPLHGLSPSKYLWVKWDSRFNPSLMQHPEVEALPKPQYWE